MMLLVICFGIIFSTSNGANIFGYFTTTSISHQAVFRPIWRELSLRGHKVTVVTPNPINDESLKNLTEIDVSYSYNFFNLTPVMNKKSSSALLWEIFVTDIQSQVFEEQMKHPHIQSILQKRSNITFDLVLVEMLYAPSYGFSHLFNCPFIGILSLTDLTIPLRVSGNPVHPVVNPDSLLGFSKELNFWERLSSTIEQIKLFFIYDYKLMPAMDKIARKYFGNDIPYLGSIEKNVSLILTAHNFIISRPKPTVPAFIEIGNVHLKKNVKLPQDLQELLDKEKNGMIYFSLGSNVKSANISEKLRNTIISVFSEIPYKVLWKWESDYLPGKPENVITRKWLPQEAVLGHPNVKVFITQGGLQSMEEAIYYRTPMVGMPFLGDQMQNVKGMKDSGIGIEIDIHTVTKEQLKAAILEVFHSKTYHEKISELADIIWDHPMSGLDTAIWWIEYVIRHKGAKHLRSPLLDIPLYQYLLLDVIAFVSGVIIFCVAFLYFAYNYVKLVIPRKSSKTKAKTF